MKQSDITKDDFVDALKDPIMVILHRKEKLIREEMSQMKITMSEVSYEKKYAGADTPGKSMAGFQPLAYIVKFELRAPPTLGTPEHYFDPALDAINNIANPGIVHEEETRDERGMLMNPLKFTIYYYPSKQLKMSLPPRDNR